MLPQVGISGGTQAKKAQRCLRDDGECHRECADHHCRGEQVSNRLYFGLYRTATDMVQFPSVYGILRYTLFRRARRYVDLDEHSWPSECSYDEKRAGRLGRARVRLCTAFAGIEEIANIRHVGYDLVNIVYGGSVLFQ